jgi:2-hydroxychromene-2-carboxylate isomerase
VNDAFYFDLGSPECYLAAERILHTLPGPCEWRPVLAADLPGGGGPGPWRCAEEREIELAEIERTAARRGLQPVRWPDELPFDSAFAMRVATYARQIGRAVAFSLAAFRQAYAGGRSLAEPDNVLVAASACEMHPKAILRAVELRSVRDELSATTAQALQDGVTSVPAVCIAGAVFHGDAALETAAAALSRT